MSAKSSPVALFAALLLACGGGTKERIATLQDQNRLLRGDVEAAGQAAAAADQYAQALTHGGDTVELLLNAGDIDALSQKVLPYRIPARNFNSMVSGEVIVERITNVRFHPGNKLTCQVMMRGDRLRVTRSIPKAYQAEVKRFLDGVTAGVVTDLEVTLSQSGNSVLARAVAKRSTLKRNRDASNEAQLTRGMNQSALRKALTFDATPEGTAHRVRGVATTPSHVVVVYGP